MLFQAMVIFLPISIFFKILSEMGKVHCHNLKDINELYVYSIPLPILTMPDLGLFEPALFIVACDVQFSSR